MSETNLQKLMPRRSTRAGGLKHLTSAWYCYIIECRDSSLYTGITTNLDARLKTHQQGLGSRYTLVHGALKIVWSRRYPSKQKASQIEYIIKRLSRQKKLSLIKKKGHP